MNPSLVTSLLKLRYCGLVFKHLHFIILFRQLSISVLVSEAESDLYAYRRTDELVTFYWKRRIYRKGSIL